ncbi:hypothetical protein ACFOEE_12090 [Pseudoalteromonas fenneropenaei]|uniref:DUF4402 domain-containing protein n=1 Tax=Pseudoalteromonas fenneropenaei TaxID=1737459 RepID=A0ABV7CL05_9GAMM
MKKRSMTLISSILMSTGCSSTPNENPDAIVVNIDQGTVVVKVVDLPIAESHRLSYAAIGSCEPEVEITTTGKQTKANHIKNCHGKGDYQGTIFTLLVSPRSELSLYLKAGQIELPEAHSLTELQQITASVSVGGISSRRGNVAINRSKLLGAKAVYQNQGTLNWQISLSYGEVVFN